jgi:hypothetical protein
LRRPWRLRRLSLMKQRQGMAALKRETAVMMKKRRKAEEEKAGKLKEYRRAEQ